MMMLLGEGLALLAIGILELQDQHRPVRARRLFLLGLVAGVAWWHYHLVVVYFAALAALLICFHGSVRSMFCGPKGIGAIALARLVLVGVLGLAIAALARGFGSTLQMGYPVLILCLLLPFAAVAAWAGWSTRSARARMAQTGGEEGSADQARWRLAPVLIVGGFIVGFAPALFYLIQLREEFWIPTVKLVLSDIAVRTRNLFALYLTFMMGFIEPSAQNPAAQTITARSYINVGIYVLAGIVTVQRLFKPDAERPGQKAGLVYFLTLAATILLLHIFLPKATDWHQPRFLVPLFAATSIVLGLAAEEISATAGEGAGKRRRYVTWAAGATMAVGALALWGPMWLKGPSEKMHWPTGHRRQLIDLIEDLNGRGIERLVLVQDHNLGFEVQFASGLGIRFNQGMHMDRLVGRMDESRYGGTEYHLHWDVAGARGLARFLPPELARVHPRLPPGAFKSGGFIFYLPDPDAPNATERVGGPGPDAIPVRPGSRERRR